MSDFDFIYHFSYVYFVACGIGSILAIILIISGHSEQKYWDTIWRWAGVTPIAGRVLGWW